MAAPTAYTEVTLKIYMHTVLGAVATALGWSVAAGSYDEAVNETLLAYGVSTISSATNIRKLRALARREAWRSVMTETAGDYNVDMDGDRLDRSQFHAQAKASFVVADAEASQYDVAGYAVKLATVEHTGDPYTALELEE